MFLFFFIFYFFQDTDFQAHAQFWASVRYIYIYFRCRGSNPGPFGHEPNYLHPVPPKRRQGYISQGYLFKPISRRKWHLLLSFSLSMIRQHPLYNSRKIVAKKANFKDLFNLVKIPISSM